MANNDVVTPSQVLEAIKHAIEISKDANGNPSDKYGDGAFRVLYNNPQVAKNDVRYMPFEVLRKKKSQSGVTWEFVPLNLKFVNLITRSRIYPVGHEKRKFASVQLQFSCDDSYTIKTKAREVNGNIIEHESVEKYGEVKKLIVKAFQRIVVKLLKEKKIFNKNVKVALTVQFEREVDKNTKKTEKLPVPITRTEVPFRKDENNKIDKNEKPLLDIFDIERPLKKDDPRLTKDRFPFEYALASAENNYEQGVTYENITDLITPGSSVSGVDSMSRACLSNLGISLPSKFTLLMVKKNKGFRPDPKAIFRTSDIELMDQAETQNIEEIPDEYDEPTEKVTVVKGDEFDPVEKKKKKEPEPEPESGSEQEAEVEDEDF